MVFNESIVLPHEKRAYLEQVHFEVRTVMTTPIDLLA